MFLWLLVGSECIVTIKLDIPLCGYQYLFNGGGVAAQVILIVGSNGEISYQIQITNMFGSCFSGIYIANGRGITGCDDPTSRWIFFRANNVPSYMIQLFVCMVVCSSRNCGSHIPNNFSMMTPNGREVMAVLLVL